MSTPVVMPVDQPPLTESSRVINTIVAPSKTFTDIRRNASWWVPWLVLSVVSLAFAFTVDKRVGFDTVMQNLGRLTPKQAEKMEQMPPDQRAKVEKVQVMSRKVMSYAAPVGLLLLFCLALGAHTGLFGLFFSLFVGGREGRRISNDKP